MGGYVGGPVESLSLADLHKRKEFVDQVIRAAFDELQTLPSGERYREQRQSARQVINNNREELAQVKAEIAKRRRS